MQRGKKKRHSFTCRNNGNAQRRQPHRWRLGTREQRWQQRTRRRYGALALVGDFAVGGLLLLVLVFPLYVARRQRNRQRLAALLAADEAAERAARRSAIDALLRGDDETDLGAGTPEVPPS